MDMMTNPFSPNAGSRPPELVGRDRILEEARVLMGRTQLRRSEQSMLIKGLRGVGKTVILNEIASRAEAMGNVLPVCIEACESKTLGELIAVPLKMALLKLSRYEGAMDKLKTGLSVLRNFMGSIHIHFEDVDLELEPMKGVGNSGDRQFDLIEVMKSVAEAAAQKNQAVVLLIDEVHCLGKDDLETLVMGLHKMQQLQLPLAMIGAGLPIIVKLAGMAKTYAERLFRFPDVGPLDKADVDRVIEKPLQQAGVKIEKNALDMIYAQSLGYPYFVQQWGKQLWNYVSGKTVSVDDVRRVKELVEYSLDADFFMMRMERVTPSEYKFLLGMSRCVKNDVCPIAEVAHSMRVELAAIAQRRVSLIKKGLIYCPSRGVVAFTVPMFAEYLKRNR